MPIAGSNLLGKALGLKSEPQEGLRLFVGYCSRGLTCCASTVVTAPSIARAGPNVISRNVL